ncbi:MAG: D-alanine--D-alanine ligase [Alphaproteobacteria bacterium]|nr:MAG: D-alanine--D-alanine ligase [Alphaproteobacteria bacterium]
MSRRVAVLMGGLSAEREVSLVSGRACAAALREAGYEVREIEVGGDVAALLRALIDPVPDVVFNALHGRWGEDGCVQGLLELLCLPYTHSGVLASALAMDKQMTKRIAAAAGVVSPEGRVVPVEEVLAGDVMARPYVVKPVHEGSSVGVHIVREGDNTPPLDARGWRFGTKVLVEKFIPGRELTVGVMGARALAVTEIRPREGFYDYQSKYTDGRAEHLIPAPVPAQVAEAAMAAAVAAHRALGCRGVTRSDFRYDDTGAVEGDPVRERLYFLEINTQPGMTPLSLVPEQAAHVGLSFVELCSWMVENATCDSSSL